LLFPGTSVAGTYEIRHLIAEGGLAEIYLACHKKWQINDGCFIAIKRLKPEHKNDIDIVAWFKEESEIIYSLRHPRIVHGFGLIEENEELFILMEYVKGRTLFDLRARAAMCSLEMRIKIVVALGMALCEALGHLHRQKDKDGRYRHLIHGDISLQNIMLCLDGLIKIVDFGNAMDSRSARARTSARVCGNERYMPPEQKLGRMLSPRSDIYSVAVVLLKLLGPMKNIAQSPLAKELLLILRKAAHEQAKMRHENCHSFGTELQSLADFLNMKDGPLILKNLYQR